MDFNMILYSSDVEFYTKKDGILLENQINKLSEYVKVQEMQSGRPMHASVRTFGCQMNAHDSEKLEDMLLRMGYTLTTEEKQADLVLINTCCVRENAENKLYGHLGAFKNIKRENPDMKLVVCGCMTQQGAVAEKLTRTYKHVDIIFGTFNLHRFPDMLLTHLESGSQLIDIWEEPDNTDLPAPEHRHFSMKASVNIVYGCDNFCSFCIVPYVRGRERSRHPDDILKEILQQAKCGASEVMLLGQNVNSYGKSGIYLGNQTSPDKPVYFSDLLNKTCEIDDIKRIRFMTSHPKDISEDLIKTMRDQPKICKHLHLPVQSGSSRILNLMNRQYTKESFLELVKRLKEQIPNIALSTDIIVGFPGETEEDFEDTLDLVEQVRFSGAFTFIYSKRPGTAAASLESNASESEIKSRFNRLLSVLNPIILEENQKQIGKVLHVLAENVNENDPSLLTGRTDCNRVVHFSADESSVSKFVSVKITGCKTFYLTGEKT